MFAGEMPIFLAILASTSAAAAPRRAARSAERRRPLHTAGPSSWGRPSANPSAASPAAKVFPMGFLQLWPFIRYNL